MVCDKAQTITRFNIETLEPEQNAEPIKLYSLPVACASSKTHVAVGCKSGEILLFKAADMALDGSLKDYHIACSSLEFSP